MTEQRDILQNNNKYVDHSTIKIDSKYLWKRRLGYLLNLVVFIVLIGAGSFIGYKMFKPTVLVDKEIVPVQTTVEYGVGDIVAFSDDTIPNFFHQTGLFSSIKGKIKTLPLGLSKVKKKQLNEYTYEIECQSASCQSTTYFVTESQLLGRIEKGE